MTTTDVREALESLRDEYGDCRDNSVARIGELRARINRRLAALPPAAAPKHCDEIVDTMRIGGADTRPPEVIAREREAQEKKLADVFAFAEPASEPDEIKDLLARIAIALESIEMNTRQNQ